MNSPKKLEKREVSVNCSEAEIDSSRALQFLREAILLEPDDASSSYEQGRLRRYDVAENISGTLEDFHLTNLIRPSKCSITGCVLDPAFCYHCIFNPKLEELCYEGFRDL